MGNFNIKIDLKKLRNAECLDNVNGKGKCIVIPVEDNEIFLSERGAAYLQLNAREMKQQKYGQTHFIKWQASKKMYASLPEEEKKNIPILGQMSPQATPGQQNNGGGYSNNQSYSTPVQTSTPSSDLPF